MRQSLRWTTVAATFLWVATFAEQCSAQSWTTVDDRTAFTTFERDGRAFYTLSIDGGATAATIETDNLLKLRYGTFDPMTELPEIPAALAAPSDGRLFIVQYFTQDTDSYRRAVDALGVERLHHLPENAVLLRGDAAQMLRIATLPFVRFVTPYHPAYRIDETMLAEFERGAVPTRWYNLLVSRRGLAEKEAVRARVLALGGETDAVLPAKDFIMRAKMDRTTLLDIIRRDDVLFVDLWSAPENDMDLARQIGGANSIESTLGFTGQGVRGEVMDGGLQTTHVDFQSPAPVLHGAVGVDSHGTSTFGQIFGDGTADPTARGMIPDAIGIIASYTNLTDRYVHTQDLLTPAYEAVFQSNSWGSTLTAAYTTISAEMDTIIFDLDFLICQSQSNNGNQLSRPQAWAKNIVSVGGIKHQNTLTTADDNWTTGASIGPAADGRIKPDISSFYDAIRTTTSGSDTAYTSSFGGTSGATPIVAGHFGIFYQMWNAGLFPVTLPVPGGSVFQNRPHATTAKAMMLNTTTQYAFSGTAADLTRVHQGWGYPNLQTMYDHRQKMLIVNETTILSSLQTASHFVVVGNGEPEFRATLVYADPAALPAAAIHRLNDLTLKVTDPHGTIYWGNNGLLAGNVSLPGGSADTINTVEQVIIPTPIDGLWTIEVIASAVVVDGHVETPAVDADYALVVRGGTAAPTSGTPDSGQANQVGSILSVAGAVNVNGQPPLVGTNGPFFAERTGGNTLNFNVTTNPNRSMVMLYGPLGKNNYLFPTLGSLDVGLLGGSLNFGDIAIVIDGLNPTTFIDLLGSIGASGQQTIGVSIPSSFPPGILGTFQALIVDPANTSTARLTAAIQVTIN